MDCRIATQFCTPLTRPPWLDIPWQERNTAPEPIKESIPPKKKHSCKKEFRSLSPSKGTFLKKIICQKMGFLDISRNVE
ncbi:MAG: hypothetical protein II397_13720, partial [Treponema sp.]|nr:hypothetical protein [Treponema sp.]